MQLDIPVDFTRREALTEARNRLDHYVRIVLDCDAAPDDEDRASLKAALFFLNMALQENPQ